MTKKFLGGRSQRLSTHSCKKVKFIYSGKATIFLKISHLVLTLLSNVKTNREILCPSQKSSTLLTWGRALITSYWTAPNQTNPKIPKHSIFYGRMKIGRQIIVYESNLCAVHVYLSKLPEQTFNGQEVADGPWPGLANRPVRAVWPFGPALAYYEFILSIFPLTGLKSRQDLNYRFCIQTMVQL